MNPKLIIFQTKNTKFLIERFRLYGFEPLVDAVHQKDFEWLNHNFNNYSHRFFKCDDYLEGAGFCAIKEIRNIDRDEEFDFVLTFNEPEKISFDKWFQIVHWVTVVVYKSQEQEFFKSVDADMVRPHIQKIIMEDEIIEDHPTVPDSYGFRYQEIIGRDTCVYEVLKPFTDLPYTTVTRNFSEKGHRPFFSSLFICKSWGVANHDLLFLKQAWNFLGMKGDCDLQAMHKERVEACFPCAGPPPEREPEVYRRSLEQVLEFLNDLDGGGVSATGCMHSQRKRKIE